MTVEADLFTVLRTVATRVYPDFAEVGTVRPYVTYQGIGGTVISYLGREVPSKKHRNFQVNVWGDTRMSVEALALQIEAALIAATVFQASPIAAPVSDFDADIPVYGARQDWSIWSDR